MHRSVVLWLSCIPPKYLCITITLPFNVFVHLIPGNLMPICGQIIEDFDTIGELPFRYLVLAKSDWDKAKMGFSEEETWFNQQNHANSMITTPLLNEQAHHWNQQMKQT